MSVKRQTKTIGQVVTSFKILTSTAVLGLVFPLAAFANDDTLLTAENIEAAMKGRMDRTNAVQITAKLGACAGFYEGTAQYYKGLGIGSAAFVTWEKADAYELAAFVVSLRTGENADHIKSLRADGGKTLAAQLKTDPLAGSDVEGKCKTHLDITKKLGAEALAASGI